MALGNDARFAIRQLRKSPGFTIVVLITLGLCIGVNTAIFSVLDAVLLRPAPFPEPDRLALVTTLLRGKGGEELDTSQTGALFEAVRDRAAGLDAAAWSRPSGANFVANGRPEYIQQQRVSAGYFRVMGIAPRMGREFAREEDVPKGPALAVLSYGLWERAFRGDPQVLGRRIDLKGEDHVVIGVMPADFHAGAAVDVWTPLRPSRDGEGSGDNYGVTARLRPGVSWQAANAQLKALSVALREEKASAQGDMYFEEGVMPLQAGLATDDRRELMITWGAVLLVLLIGCVNIAGLLLARTGARAREIATRMALGGRRGMIVRQLLMESVLLAAVGGWIGVGVGGFVLDWLKGLGAAEHQLFHTIELDARVLVVMIATALFTSLLFGLAPAMAATRLDIRSALGESGRGVTGGARRRRWPRQALVVVEVALSLVLLVGAGLLVRTLAYMNGLNPGFDTRNVIAAEASLQDKRYETLAETSRLYDETLARIRAIPGVTAAAVALTLPYERPYNNGMRVVDGGDGEMHTIRLVYTTTGYFDAMRIPLYTGRVPRTSDTEKTARALVVSQSFADKFLRKEPAVGHHISLGGKPWEIVGVVGDVQQHDSFKPALGPITVDPTVYVPLAQLNSGFIRMAHTWFSPKWVIRTNGPVGPAIPKVRAAVAEVDPNLPIAHFRTVEELSGIYTRSQRYLAALFSMLAGLAVLLAAIGLYGLISQSIAQRRHELGIRMALGASARQTIAGVMKPALLLALVGIAMGLALSASTVRLMRALVFGVREHDPVTFIAMAILLMIVAAVASLAPALRILRLDPAETLRGD